MIDIYSDNGHIKGSIELVGDTAFIGDLQHGNFPCANPKSSGPYPVTCDHLLSITWTIKGQYRTYGNSMEACSRTHIESLYAIGRRLTVWLTGGADWRVDTIIMARNSGNAPQSLGAVAPSGGTGVRRKLTRLNIFPFQANNSNWNVSILY